MSKDNDFNTTKVHKTEVEKILEEYEKNPIKVTLEEDEKPQPVKPTTKPILEENVDLKESIISNKQRKEKIKGMALENCSEYETQVYDCLRNGSWLDRLKMCNEQYSQFWNCVSKQKLVLDNIGYGRPSNSKYMDEQLAEAGYDVVIEERRKESEKVNEEGK